MIKVIFLDIDNTLLSFDEYVKHAMQEGFFKFHLPPFREEMFPVFKTINDGLWNQIEQGALTFEELQKIRWNKIFQALGTGYVFDGCIFETYFREYLYDSAILEPGAMELVETLSKQYPLYIVSNGPYHQQINRLKISGMLPYFTEIYVSEDIGYSKPSAKFFEACYRRLNVNQSNPIRPEETLIIGDSLSADISGGIQYGLKTCYYNRKQKAVPEGLPIDFIVTTLSEIPGKL